MAPDRRRRVSRGRAKHSLGPPAANRPPARPKRTAPAADSCSASGSRCGKLNRRKVHPCLPVFEPLRQYPQHQRLHTRQREFVRIAIREDARQLYDLRQPAAIRFSVDFNVESDRGPSTSSCPTLSLHPFHGRTPGQIGVPRTPDLDPNGRQGGDPMALSARHTPGSNRTQNQGFAV